MVKITVLIDNTPAPQGSGLLSEHGLSMLVETPQGAVLVDTGASDAFLENASKMGLDLSGARFCFISHGHADHTGGLRGFMERYPQSVILSAEIFTSRFFSSSRGEPRDISIDHTLLDDYLERFNCVEGSCRVDDSLHIVKCSCDTYPRPSGNTLLTKSGLEEGSAAVQDDFGHELSLALRTSEGVVVISSCSHCGAANIIESSLEALGESRLRAFVGGLHFTEKTSEETLMTDVSEFLTYIQEHYPDAEIYTGHCTSPSAQGLLSVSPKVHIFRTGDVISLPSYLPLSSDPS